MVTTAVILSGGKGTRAGTQIPKQYISVGEKPLLSYTIRAFEKSRVDHIILVAGEGYQELCREIAKNCGCTRLQAVLTGGTERYDSVRKALSFLMREEEAAKTPADRQAHYVLIHDGARPFIRPETINHIMDQTAEYGAVIAATPCTDTIKVLDADGFIACTTERKNTYAAQTPQAFLLRDIWQAYEQIIGAAHVPAGITDDAMVYQLAFPDRKVKVVDAGAENRKITTAQDLAVAQMLLTE